MKEVAVERLGAWGTRLARFPLRLRGRVPRPRPQVVVALLIIGLVGAMAIEPTRQLMAQRERITGMATDLDRLERSNARLEHEIERLEDPDFIEQRAREVGLIRPGEIPFVVMRPSRGARRDAQRRTVPTPQPDRPYGFVDGFLNFLGL